MSRIRFVVPVIVALTTFAPWATAEENRWEPTIQRFEKKDAENPPPKGEILFIGSSSIVAWKTDEDFPDHTIVKRGFGGSFISDSVYFADRIAIPYEPRLIIMYAGDNDIASGKSPEEVFGGYRKFVAKIHNALPETRIAYVCIKPSLARWKLVGKMRETNAMIRGFCEEDERLEYIDIDTPMLGDDGKPREELFRKDGLHLSREGYDLWNKIVRPYLGAENTND